MAAPETIRARLVREQSAALAAMLAGTPAAPEAIPAAPPAITANERRLLTALADGTPRRADEIIAGQQTGSARASIHLTARGLLRKGGISRHKRSRDKDGGRVAYKITEAGRNAL
jgi:hypothetical protein